MKQGFVLFLVVLHERLKQGGEDVPILMQSGRTICLGHPYLFFNCPRRLRDVWGSFVATEGVLQMKRGGGSSTPPPRLTPLNIMGNFVDAIQASNLLQ